ncbi:MAG: BtrH N-terminal domain-containing protein, partial [Corynebacteriales bacterium]|nr:BtrH N-terminal domain-containing protein [Mycobacteriales bacterium]
VLDEIDAGRPSMVWGDIAELPYLRVQLQMSRHDIVVIGYDTAEGIAFVVDNDRAEVQEVPLDALARARSSTAFPQPTRHSTYRINWPETLPDLAGIAAGAFRQSAEGMRRPQPGIVGSAAMTAGVEGLPAAKELAADVETWADLPVDELEILLFSLGAFIEKAGSGGGLFRRLLADGCADVARLTGDPATADLAVVAGRCAQAWTETARAGVQREVDVHTRVAAVAAAVNKLPALEAKLVEHLESASTSLQGESR